MFTAKRATALLLAASLVVGGCGMIPGLIQKTINFVSEISAASYKSTENGEVAKEFTPENEYFIGRGVSAAIVDKYPSTDLTVGKSQDQVAYLNQMGGYIEAAAGAIDRTNLGGHVERDDEQIERLGRFALFKGVHVGLLETNEVMAYSTPGGYIWISRGTIAMCENEDQLAAVIAHETGHMVMNHGMDAYRKATEGKITDSPIFKAATSSLGPVVGNFAKLVGGFADNLILNGYGKDQEFEADNFGTRALGAAGYDPKAMVHMMERLEAYEKAHEKDEGSFSKNHPEPADRIEQIQKLIKDPKAGLKSPASDPGKPARDKRFKEIFGR